MKNQKTPVNKRVTVYRSRTGNTTLFAMPTPEPTIVGYVVRYENGGPDGGLSEPLQLHPEPWAGVKDMLVNNSGATDQFGSGSIFPDFESAKSAVLAAIKFQQKNNLRWNEFYGNYLIDPVIAR